MITCSNILYRKMNSELGEIIRLIKAELRKKGWSQAKLAEALGRSGGWLSHIMHDKRRLTVQAVFDIAHVLGIDPTSLLPHNSENESSPKLGLDEYIRNIVKEEISKSNKEEG